METFQIPLAATLMSFCIDDDKLTETCKSIGCKTEGLQSSKLNALPVYDDRRITDKKRTNGDKFYTNFRKFKIPEDGAEYERILLILYFFFFF